MGDKPKEWTVRSGLGLFWIYGGELHVLVNEQNDPASVPPRPARDVLRALLAYAIEQIDEAGGKDG